MSWLLLILAWVCGCAGLLLGASAGAKARRELWASHRRECGRLTAETAERIRLAGDVAELAAHVLEVETRPHHGPGVN